MKQEKAKQQGATKAKRPSRLLPTLIVVGLMAIEGVGVYMLANALRSDPVEAKAAGAL